jgi:hypothetical protein
MSDATYVALQKLVAGIDEWNESVQKVIGRQVDYKWPALEEARKLVKAREVLSFDDGKAEMQAAVAAALEQAIAKVHPRCHCNFKEGHEPWCPIVVIHDIRALITADATKALAEHDAETYNAGMELGSIQRAMFEFKERGERSLEEHVQSKVDEADREWENNVNAQFDLLGIPSTAVDGGVFSINGRFSLVEHKLAAAEAQIIPLKYKANDFEGKFKNECLLREMDKQQHEAHERQKLDAIELAARGTDNKLPDNDPAWTVALLDVIELHKKYAEAEAHEKLAVQSAEEASYLEGHDDGRQHLLRPSRKSDALARYTQLAVAEVRLDEHNLCCARDTCVRRAKLQAAVAAARGEKL